MLNVVALMGRLVADPELKHTPNNVAVVSFRIAVDRSFQKAGTERVADFINIVAWRNTAEFVARYFKKGALMAVNGSLQTRNYTDKDGNKRQAFEVVADNVHFAESKRDGGSGSGGDYGNNDFSNREAPPQFSTVDSGDFQEISSGDDDLPF